MWGLGFKSLGFRFFWVEGFMSSMQIRVFVASVGMTNIYIYIYIYIHIYIYYRIDI